MDAQTLNKMKYEQSWLDHSAASFSNWNQMRALYRTYAWHGKTFVVWEILDGRPVIQELFKIDNIALSHATGLELTFVDTRGKYSRVDSQTTEISKDVFFWIPAFSELRYTPTNFDDPGSPRRLTVALCMKTRSRADRQQIEQHRYCMSIKEFSAIWPNVL